uniref:Bone morphogenetic protein receptor type-2 n=1 Tax=Anthurium amnicola TaxID=1678845 RepID=A0A1D1XM31_9ARAE
MRLAISVAFLLLLLLFTTVQGIRLKGEPLGAFQGKLQEEKSSAPTVGESPVAGTHLCSEGGRCSGTVEKRRIMKEVEGAHHWLPRFHEDYYGPRNHKPKHH